MLAKKAFHLSLALFVVSIYVSSAFACLNPIGQYYISDHISLEKASGQELIKVLGSHKDQAYWQDVLQQILDRKRRYPVGGYHPNNHAVALAHLGRVREAILILEEIERKKPGQYATAANLGTVYELNGENDKALQWIKEGVKRNKDGHNGSEWLHVKILETKLKLEKEPGWLASNTILNIQFDSGTEVSELHTIDHLGQRRTLQEIESALIYQLHERLEFIKPPEPVVADLLADLSGIFSIVRGEADSRVIYDFARTYGSSRPIYLKPPLIDVVEPTGSGWSNRFVVLGVFGGLSLLAAMFLIWFRSRSK